MAAGFETVRDRLEKLDGWFLIASDDAYREGITGLTRVGPVGAAPGISRLVEVRCRHLAERDGWAGCALRWEVRGSASGLFPVLDADLILTPVTEDTSLLTLTGTYRSPLASLGAGIDRLILRRVAQGTFHDFLKRRARSPALGRAWPDRRLPSAAVLTRDKGPQVSQRPGIPNGCRRGGWPLRRQQFAGGQVKRGHRVRQ